VFISEKVAPEDFVSIWTKDHNVYVNTKSRTEYSEHLFIHRSIYDQVENLS